MSNKVISLFDSTSTGIVHAWWVRVVLMCTSVSTGGVYCVSVCATCLACSMVLVVLAVRAGWAGMSRRLVNTGWFLGQMS